VVIIKAILYNIDAFDSSHDIIFKFIWNGNQAFGNILYIYENGTKLIYKEPETTMQLKHTLPENILTNGKTYTAKVSVIDIDGNESELSDPILFCCFTTPTFIFNNLTENTIVKNASYEVNMSYYQIENEPLQSWEISLYDMSQNKIQGSGICYTNEIKYTLTSLEDNQRYYIRATCMTLNGMEVSTDFILFKVEYKRPSVYSLLTLENVYNGGYIKLQSNIRAVEAHAKKDIEYVGNECVNLKNNTVYIDKDFSLNDDFIINLLGYNLTHNALIMQLSDSNNAINLYLRKGIYETNNNIEKTFVELNIPIGFTSYVCYSNYINNPSSTDMLDIWLKKKDGLYSVYIINKGGE
jgi:hypothetical protein